MNYGCYCLGKVKNLNNNSRFYLADFEGFSFYSPPLFVRKGGGAGGGVVEQKGIK